MLLALPVVAEPPVVLPDTLAEPLLADWLFVLLTQTSLSLETVELSVQFDVTLLVEPGPVVLMLPWAFPGAAAAVLPPVLDELLTVSEAIVPLLLLAVPEPAEPPVVLPDTLAEPV